MTKGVRQATGSITWLPVSIESNSNSSTGGKMGTSTWIFDSMQTFHTNKQTKKTKLFFFFLQFTLWATWHHPEKLKDTLSCCLHWLPFYESSYCLHLALPQHQKAALSSQISPSCLRQTQDYQRGFMYTHAHSHTHAHTHIHTVYTIIGSPDHK